MTFKTYETNERITIAEKLHIKPVLLNHGFPCWGFIVENGKYKIGIVTYTNFVLPEETKKALEGCDILFIDAFSENYTQIEKLFEDIHEPTPEDLEFTWAHLTIEQAIERVRLSKSKLGVALHISHYSSPHDMLVEKYETDSFQIGYDGMEFNLE